MAENKSERETGGGGPGADVLERRLRMTLDFRVLIGDAGEESFSDGRDDDEERVNGREHLGRQRRLLRTLLGDEAASASEVGQLYLRRFKGEGQVRGEG